MPSKSSKPSINDDIKLLIEHQESLKGRFNVMGKATAEGLTAILALNQGHAKRLKFLDRSNTVLTLAVALQAIALIIIL